MSNDKLHEVLTDLNLSNAQRQSVIDAVTADKKHNGWTNYETWAFALHQDNDKWSYDAVRRIAKSEYQKATPDKYMTKSEVATHSLAQSLKNNAEEAAEGLAVTGVFRDLLDCAVSEVNFYEIAKNLIDELIDELKKG